MSLLYMSVYRQKGFCVISSSRQILLNILDGVKIGLIWRTAAISIVKQGATMGSKRVFSVCGMFTGHLFLWGNSLSSEKCTVLLHNHSFFYIKVTKKEEISKFLILCPILNAFFLFKMLIIICYRWTIDENKYFILGRGLKGTQILKYCIFGRHIEL